VAVRYGGEEFAVILWETTLSEAFQVARRIHCEVTALAIPHPTSYVWPTLSLSLGVASIFPCPEGDPVMLTEAADRALYAAKRKGRNRIECAEAERMS
jgi:diguanylate cyclase (GGDEF)-like protein